MIHETVVTTRTRAGQAHVTPLGVQRDGEFVVLAPFRPSTTLDAILDSSFAVVNATDDVRIFAGCIVGRRDWPLCDADRIPGVRLRGALSHEELELVEAVDDPVRPRLRMRRVHAATHAPFPGFNRAQAAVIEAAILVSRLRMLPAQKIDAEIAYLSIAVDKTAGPAEREAWGWLMDAITTHRGAAGAAAAK
ncbi:MAG TPA: DUF447 domain-containing protein [Burkholderiaceae bacterium]|nr:DUF447 domain-containing protein [Burkholderiaceae bacterium]